MVQACQPQKQAEPEGWSKKTTVWYVYGNQIDEPLAVSTSVSDASYIKYYLLDHLNSPVVLFDRIGTVNERYEYDAVGIYYFLLIIYY